MTRPNSLPLDHVQCRAQPPVASQPEDCPSVPREASYRRCRRPGTWEQRWLFCSVQPLVCSKASSDMAAQEEGAQATQIEAVRKKKPQGWKCMPFIIGSLLCCISYAYFFMRACIIDEQKARGPVARPKHGRHGTAQARHGPEDTGLGLGTARVPGRAWAARQARRVETC